MSSSFFSKLPPQEDGSVTVELALVAPILALTIIGIVDLSNAFSRKLAIEQGAHRAIEKVMQTTGVATVANTIKTEAVCQVNGMNTNGSCKSSPITEANVTVSYRLECATGATVNSTQTKTSSTEFDALSCSSGETERRYISVTVTDKYTPMFPVHFAAINADGTYHLSTTAGMRTQ
jgi:Flp pilus assembly protein TadG